MRTMKREVLLEEYVKNLVESKKKNKWSIIREIYEKTRSGELKLKDPDPPRTLVEYAFRLEYSMWFWTTLILVVLTLLVIYITSILPQLLPLRYMLGTLFVLFLPGFVLIEALYPGEKDLKPLERLALSIGLSLAVVPLIGLVLNYTPWGIRLEPIMASLAIYTLGVSIIALNRKYRVFKVHKNTKY